ncbi:hypothetical protein F9K79_09520 [Ochrobactrum sp. Kaboul]|nr:hypothetical protein F9K79_09520 [Ochrobactrum sp. Kaboul]
MVHNDGLLATVPLIGVSPLQIDSPDGIDGPPLIRAEVPNYPLGKLLGASLSSAETQVVPILMATAYIIRRIVITGSTATPLGVTATISTLPNGGGIVLASGIGLSTLTDRSQIVEVEPAARRLEAPYLYLTLSTGLVAGEVDIFVFGDALRPLED